MYHGVGLKCKFCVNVQHAVHILTVLSEEKATVTILCYVPQLLSVAGLHVS